MMNDSTTPTPTPAPASSAVSSASPASASAATPTLSSSAMLRQHPVLLLLVLALAFFSWQWIEIRARLSDTQQELGRRLSESASSGKESLVLARQAQDQALALQGRLALLEAKFAESQSQQAALDSLYQDLARNRDDWALAEIEQNITLAAQQLQLAGNVQGAVLALQAADARLAASVRPQFIGLRKVVARDLDRLRALPQLDMPGLSVRLENVIVAVEQWPLLADVRPQGEQKSLSGTAANLGNHWGARFVFDLWEGFKGLVRIERLDRVEPVLLAPSQLFFLRENLKLRLLNARLALLSRDQLTFHNDLAAAQVLIHRYYDSRDKGVQVALNTLKQLGATHLNIELPTLNESLSAIRMFKSVREKDVRR